MQSRQTHLLVERFALDAVFAQEAVDVLRHLERVGEDKRALDTAARSSSFRVIIAHTRLHVRILCAQQLCKQ